VKLKLTRRAERRIEIVDDYWRQHRLEASDLLKQELSAARLRLAQDPYVGTAIVVGGKQLRRLLLPRTEQWLYYAVRPKQQLIVVQTLWGARRGREPKL
jgi:plasmid stabilization system protein ParE